MAPRAKAHFQQQSPPCQLEGMTTAAWTAKYWSNCTPAHALDSLPMDNCNLLPAVTADNLNNPWGDDQAGEAWIEPIKIGIDAAAPVLRDHLMAGQPACIKSWQFLKQWPFVIATLSVS